MKKNNILNSLVVAILVTIALSVGGTEISADPGDVCDVDGDCDDGLWCNGEEECIDSQCYDGDPIVCDNPPSEICYESPGTCDEEVDECHYTAIDDGQGPDVYDLLVTPNPSNGIFSVFAVAEDECGIVQAANFYIDNECLSDEVSMDASDGSFNEAVEDIEKLDYEADLTDGTHNLWIEAQDNFDNWGGCVGVAFEVDILPPNLESKWIENSLWEDDVGHWICAYDGDLRGDICDPYGESLIDMAEYLVDDFNVPAGQGYPMNASDGAFDESCEEVMGTINNGEFDEGRHDARIRGKDAANNWGKVLNQDPLWFVIDRSSPMTEKNITFADDVYVECDIEEANGEEITDGCYYVKSGTEITLTAEDADPQGTGEVSDDVTIHYIVYYSYDGSEWNISLIDWGEPGEPVTITLEEDSYHLIEYWGTDLCGNEEEHHFELDIVDTQAPESVKYLGEPKVECSEDEKQMYGIDDCWYVNDQTYVGLSCEDVMPHPVGNVTLYHRIDWKEQWEDEWELGQWIESDGSTEFNYEEESFHRLTWYCKDALGNEEGDHVELDIVDLTEPEVNKIVGDPKVPAGRITHLMPDPSFSEVDDSWYITQDTPITLECEDLGIHPVDDVVIYYKYYNDGDLVQNWTEYTEPFTYGEDTYHELYYYCQDALGNEGPIHYEVDLVDTVAPTTYKTVGEPKYPGEYPVDWWITQDTTITLECFDDDQPHPVGNVSLYWRDYLDEDEPPEDWWIEFDGVAEIQKEEDSLHVLEWFCRDALGNEEYDQIEYDQVDTAPPEINKFVIVDGERIYAPDEGVETVAVQTGETLKFCAEVNDVKQTGDHGVGVMNVSGRLSELDDPIMEWDEDEQAYCFERIAQECGYWHFEVRARDLLYNTGDWEDGIEIIIDNVPPLIEVLMPHSGEWYHDGKIFSVYAPVIDFGGDGLYPDGECPASGVSECTFYAVDFDWEGVNQTEVKDLWDYIQELIDMGYDPIVTELGTVPALPVGNEVVCDGYLQLLEESGLTDVAFLAADVSDNAGNMYSWLVFNPLLSPITMNIDNEGPHVSITEVYGLDGAVTGYAPEDSVTFTATVEEYDSQPNVCRLDLYKYVEEDGYELSRQGIVEVDVENYECTLTADIPIEDMYGELIESGDYKFELVALDNEDNVGSDWFTFMMDNTRPIMGVTHPQQNEVYGNMLPVSLHIEDSQSPVAEETVQFRVHELAGPGNLWCLLGCEDSGWIPLSYYDDGMYSTIIDLSANNISGESRYNFDAIACDDLYYPDEDPDNPLGVDLNLDRNTMHCKMISAHGAADEPMPECSDGVDNDGDGYIDYPMDLGCENAEDDDESDEAMCGNGDLEGDEECDDGELNGIPCDPVYGDSCDYCSESCEIITLEGAFCGDGDLDEPYEECEFDEDCSEGMTCDECSCIYE